MANGVPSADTPTQAATKVGVGVVERASKRDPMATLCILVTIAGMWMMFQKMDSGNAEMLDALKSHETNGHKGVVTSEEFREAFAALHLKMDDANAATNARIDRLLER